MADLLDVISLGDGVMAALGVPAGHEARIEPMITAVSRRIDALCGPVVQREVTEYHSGRSAIFPYQTPIVSVTSLTAWDGNTSTVLAADVFGVSHGDYRLNQSTGYPHGAPLYLRAYWGTEVQLVYTAGRYATTASVDPLFKTAAEAILRRLWDREASAWARASDPFDETLATSSRFFNAVDHVVKELLGHEMRLPGVA